VVCGEWAGDARAGNALGAEDGLGLDSHVSCGRQNPSQIAMVGASAEGYEKNPSTP